MAPTDTEIVQAAQAGFATPGAYDDIRDGDNCITANAVTAHKLHTKNASAITTINARTRSLPDLPAAWGLFDSRGRGFGVWMPDGSLDVIPLKAITQQLGTPNPTSTTSIYAVGTSLTANVDNTAGNPYYTAWPARLEGLTGRPFTNGGWAGRNSATIAARLGAVPFTLTAAAALPAGAGEAVNLSLDREIDYPAAPASIAGIPGTIKRGTSATVATFTRTTAGDPWPLAVGTPVYARPTLDTSGTLIVECSRNEDPADVTGVVERTRAIIRALTVGISHPRVIVHGQPFSTNDTPAQRVQRGSMNEALRVAFPNEWADSWGWLRSDACATALGITWDAQDRADIAAGLTPSRIRLDDLHPNNLGHLALAYFFRDELTKRGWNK